MTSFNTYDYEFLVKCLSQGSLAFKAESIKRLTTLAQNDKKQFQTNSKSILTAMEDLYLEQRDDLNILCTLLLSEIILSVISKENEQLIKSKHLKFLIYNLGHPSKPSIRKASHTSLLAYIKTYHNFDALLQQYIEAGFDHENMLIKQKSINSFQSIFILEVKSFNWESEASKRLLQNMIMKAGDENLQIAKAAAQCLLSLCKNEGVKQTTENISIGYMHKFFQFLNTTEQKIPNADLKISTDDLKQIIENQRKKPKPEQAKPQQQPEQQVSKVQLKTLEQTTQNLTYQRRLEKIKKSIAANEEKEKKPEKQQVIGVNFGKLFSNINNEGSLKERTEAVEDILYKIQLNKNKPQFQGSIKAALPNILRLLKDPNPRIVGLTLRILQNIVQQIKSSDVQLQNLITVIIEKLGDPKISIRQIVSKVIRQLIIKTDKGVWIRQLLENIRKNTNTFLKDQTLNIIYAIYDENEISNINYPVAELIEKIVVFTDDPKTKIKIRTLDCLAQIVFKSGEIQRYNDYLKKNMSEVFYQMYLEKVSKFVQEKEKKLMLELEKKKKLDQTNNFRSTYQQKHSSYRKQSEDQNKLNVSLDVVKKRINSIKNKRNALSTQETSSLDRTYRTIQRIDQSNVDQDDIVLPVLPQNAQTHKASQRKKFDGSPMKTIENKNSDYMSKEDLKPLSEPDKEFKNILFDLKSNDWKVQFETINKLRRLTQFNPELILSAPNTNLHVIVLDLLVLIESLRSSVSKNALICLNQVVVALGRQVDPEMEIILQKLMKKSADTNIFISSQVQKCLRTLSLTATPAKILEKLSIYKESKNFAIKDAFINTLIIMKDEQKIRSKQYGKLAEAMALFLSQGQIDLRTKAKSGIVDICNKLGDWYRFLRGKVSSPAFKLICDLMTKNSTGAVNSEVILTPVKAKKQHTNVDLRSLTIQSKFNQKQETSIKDETRTGTRRNFVKVQQFPNQFGEIQGLIDLSSSSQWKKRIESTQGLKLLALKYPNQFVQYRSSCHFMDILSKQIVEPNIKVSVNAMEIFLQVLQPLKKLVENNMNVICSSIFNALSSTKVQIKEMAEKCTNCIVEQFHMHSILQQVCQGILYSLPKSRIHLLNKLQEHIEQIHNERKQLLFKHVFPVLNKLMEQYKSELMPHVVNFFVQMYEIMGNNMFSHVTKFKEVRELIGK